ncbi:MAG: ORF6N domain-containing protein [Pirellulales bacterium]
MAKHATKLIIGERIERAIHVVRGEKVMLDSDLAALYGVTTARLNEQVRRNRDRFPSDFAFQLTQQEFARLMSQIATSKEGRGGRRKLPYAFTEHGAIMLASVLNSPIAVDASIQVVRAFIRLRELLVSNKVLVKRLDELEAQYDKQFAVVFEAIRQLMSPPEQPPREMGFHTLRQ